MLVNLKFDTEKEDVEDLKKLYKWVGDLLAKRGVGVEAKTPVGKALQENVSSQGSVPSSQELKEKKESEKKPERTAGGCRYVDYDDKVGDMVSGLLCRENPLDIS